MADTRCAFDEVIFTYVGTPQEQAKCLLRPVLKFAHLGPPRPSLPSPLDRIIGQPVSVDKAKLKSFLTSHGISEADIGGPLAGPLSPADTSNPAAGRARYFIIHDTSSPNFLNDPFPSNINDASASLNKLDKFRTVASEKVAHVFINRAGASVTAVDFKDPLAPGRFGTKFARDKLRERRKGLLLHVEMIQPRRRDPAGGRLNDALAPDPGFPQAQLDRLALVYVAASVRRRDPAGGRLNDALAPDPGFPQAQLDRLALVYVAASVRRGEWMIPAFHAVMDITIPDGHDDPQHFDLDLWAARLKVLLGDLER